MHKTGTTSLQRALLAHGTAFAEAGCRVLVNPPQVMVKAREGFDPEWLAGQVAAAEKSGAARLIISAEAISTFSRDQMERLLACFGRHPVRVVLALRHWSGFLPSRWKQNCSRRDSQSFGGYLRRLDSAQERHIEANYPLVAAHMLAGDGLDLRIVSFDNAGSEALLLYELLRATGVAESLAKRVSATSPVLHKSKNTAFYELCRLFNGAWSAATGREQNALFLSILEHGSVRDFYDFGPLVEPCLRANPVLGDTLVSQLRGGSALVSLAPETMAAWEQRAQALLPYVQNPRDGRVFASPGALAFSCSSLEIEDLAPELCDKMVSALRIARLAAGRPPGQ